MKLIYLFIFIHFSLLSQSLSRQQTIDYIENGVNNDLITKNNYIKGKPSVKLDLIEKSRLSIKYQWEGNKDVLIYNSKKNHNRLSFDINDIISVNAGSYENFYTISALCSSGDRRCFKLEDEFLIKNYAYTFCDDPKSIGHSNFLNLFYFASQLERNKVLSALNYYFSLVREEEEKELLSDPFYTVDFDTKSENTVYIPLRQKGNIFVLDVNFTGINSLAILDSGASDVSISKELANKLLSNNLVKQDDFIEPGLYQIADGSIVKSKRFIIPYIKVGNVKIKNVKCSINNSDNVVLLGKEFLDRFKSWKIDNQNNILTLKFK